MERDPIAPLLGVAGDVPESPGHDGGGEVVVQLVRGVSGRRELCLALVQGRLVQGRVVVGGTGSVGASSAGTVGSRRRCPRALLVSNESRKLISLRVGVSSSSSSS